MHENEFTVNVKDLEDGPVTLQVNCDAAALELEDPEFEFPEKIHGDVVFSLVRPRVVGKGDLHTRAKTHCVRCLVETMVNIDAPVSVLYESEKEIRETRGEVLIADEQIVTPFNGDWIQPEEELREALMLELPPLPLCSEVCKGLCPKCGANLNEGPCNCPPENEEVSSWKTALKELKLPPGE